MFSFPRPWTKGVLSLSCITPTSRTHTTLRGDSKTPQNSPKNRTPKRHMEYRQMDVMAKKIKTLLRTPVVFSVYISLLIKNLLFITFFFFFFFSGVSSFSLIYQKLNWLLRTSRRGALYNGIPRGFERWRRSSVWTESNYDYELMLLLRY